MNKLILIILLCSTHNFFAQEIIWQKTLGGSENDWCSFIKQDKNGDYLLAGYTYNSSGDVTGSNNGSSDLWLVSLDKINGDIIWQKTIGSDFIEYVHDVIETDDGGYLLICDSWSRISGDKTAPYYGGNGDYWIIKLDADRNIVWDKTFGGTGRDEPKNAVVTSEGYLILGESDSPVSGNKTAELKGNSDIWLVMLDFDGNEIWQKTLGGSGIDLSSKIIEAGDSNFIIAGSSNSPSSADKSEDAISPSGTADFWVIKINSNGDIIWEEVYGGDNGDYSEDIIQTSDGNFVIAGSSLSQIGFDKSESPICNSIDFWILKFEPDGTIIWDKTLGGDSTDEPRSILENSKGNIVVSGDSYSHPVGYVSELPRGDSDYWLAILDQNGDFIKDKRYGGNGLDRNMAAIQDTDGNYVQVGWSGSGQSGDKTEDNYSRDWWIIKSAISDDFDTLENNRIISLFECPDSNIELNASDGVRYEWDGPNGFSSTLQNPIISKLNDENLGVYRVKVYQTGTCFTEEIVQVGLLENCDANLPEEEEENPDRDEERLDQSVFPDFFTPNGDGYNDLWSPVSSNENPIDTIYIYNRFGKLLKSIERGQSWNGTYNGKNLPSDDYWYRALFDNDQVVTGHFTLKR